MDFYDKEKIGYSRVLWFSNFIVKLLLDMPAVPNEEGSVSLLYCHWSMLKPSTG